VNRNETIGKITAVAESQLKARGHVATIDVLVQMGWLSPKDLEAWRHRRVPCLEQVVHCSIPRLNVALKAMRAHLRAIGIRPSWTAYMSWGKGAKVRLQFSRSGEATIEEAYASHWVPDSRKTPPARPTAPIRPDLSDVPDEDSDPIPF